MPKRGIAGSYGTSVFRFLRTKHNFEKVETTAFCEDMSVIHLTH